MQAKYVATVVASVMAVVAMSSGQAQQQPLTRAEVKAELERARTSGELQQLNSDYSFDAVLWPQPGNRQGGAQGRSYSSPAALNATPDAERAALSYMGEEGE